jgi:hypothetical protein
MKMGVRATRDGMAPDDERVEDEKIYNACHHRPGELCRPIGEQLLKWETIQQMGCE